MDSFIKRYMFPLRREFVNFIWKAEGFIGEYKSRKIGECKYTTFGKNKRIRLGMLLNILKL